MNAKELMIGDWVNVPKLNKPVRVGAVYRTMIMPNPDDDDVHSLIGDEYLEPIPLTEEILKANGYEEHVGEKGAYGVTIAPHFKRDDSPEVFCDGHPFAVWFDEPVDIKYVHQLQHVLRLYGAEKEIKIKED